MQIIVQIELCNLLVISVSKGFELTEHAEQYSGKSWYAYKNFCNYRTNILQRQRQPRELSQFSTARFF